ncbi:MAG TPA: sigma-54 dependent transcriptional regulator [Myxococcota bacterium]|jgi:DNA-binding NtrC family response regulator|nr:sigma-54 dependent transcriptional regulator [Myxococcota bacterium]
MAEGGPRSILVVDDEKNIRRTLKMVLEGEGYAVQGAESAEAGLASLDEEPADLVMLDVRLPGMDGMEALGRLRLRYPDLPVIMISGHATLSDAVEATRRGAFDFLEKPLDRERVLVAIRNALERRTLAREVGELRARVQQREEILGRSPTMLRLMEQVAKVAPTNGRVLITGESGTGKELVARAVHRQSQRAQSVFVKVNCAAIPAELIESELFGHEKGAFTGAVGRKRGQFEVAHGGTLFMDEIGDMAASAQAKVLRVLQNGEITRVGGERPIVVDVRIIAATNKNLEAEVKAGKFREDLYFRLNVVPVQCPALRERPDDVPLLVEQFTDQFCAENGLRRKKIGDAVMRRLQTYGWPGNVRELKNVVERMVILSDDVIQEKDLPEYITGAPPSFDHRAFAGRTLREFSYEMEREFIRAALDRHDWNVSRSAAALGIERTNLHKKMKAYGIRREGARGAGGAAGAAGVAGAAGGAPPELSAPGAETTEDGE